MNDVDVSRKIPPSERLPRLLWVAFFAGPAAWAVNLQGSYTLVPFVCGGAWRPLIHVVGLSAAVVATGGLALALRIWRKAGSPRTSDEPGRRGALEILSFASVATSGFFLFIILVQIVPVFLLDPCHR